jgi:hypothetical protein
VRPGAFLGLAVASLGGAGCATCRPDAAPVEPSVSGRSSGGTGSLETDAQVNFEVSNLFCRSPKKPAEAE